MFSVLPVLSVDLFWGERLMLCSAERLEGTGFPQAGKTMSYSTPGCLAASETKWKNY